MSSLAEPSSSTSALPTSSVPKAKLSPWIPVSLLAVTSAALAVPLFLLRQQRASALTAILSHTGSAAPPPRRHALNISPTQTWSNGSSAPPPRRVIASTFDSPTLQRAVQEPQAIDPLAEKASEGIIDSFNAPLYTLKAFSIATAVVVATGMAGIVGVKTYLGVRDTQEFAMLMRQTVLTKMPILASRIHRPTESDILLPTVPFTTSTPPSPAGSLSPSLASPISTESMSSENVGIEAWSWSAAQARLSQAYDKGGFQGWAEAALQELEAEAEIERRKRGLDR